ncbi:hypothetical protein BDV12DRAFT_209413 [Aspergillus spectabilis]
MSSPYAFETTGKQVAADSPASILNKVVLITGVSTGGLGAEFAVTISKHSPALLILASRDLSKATETANMIKQVSPNAAAEVNNYKEKIHVLANNVGTMAVPYKLTPDRIESQFGTNHIGHFLFTNLIINKLLPSNGDNSNPARVVNVSSGGYRLSWVRFGDWNFDNGKTYQPWVAYGQAKSANMLFSRSLASKLSKRGNIQTNLTNNMGETGIDPKDSEFWINDWSKSFMTIEQGTATHIYAAFHGDIGLDRSFGPSSISSN